MLYHQGLPVSLVSVYPGKQNHRDIFSVDCMTVAGKESGAFQLLPPLWWESGDVTLVVLTERTSASPHRLLPASPFLSHSPTHSAARISPCGS